MDPKDKKDIVELMGKVIDAKVTPRLVKIEEKQKEHDGHFKSNDLKLDKLSEQNEHIIEQVVKNSEDIEMVKIDVKEMKEDVSDANFTSQRIESKLNRRVLHLESKKA